MNAALLVLSLQFSPVIGHHRSTLNAVPHWMQQMDKTAWANKRVAKVFEHGLCQIESKANLGDDFEALNSNLMNSFFNLLTIPCQKTNLI